MSPEQKYPLKKINLGVCGSGVAGGGVAPTKVVAKATTGGGGGYDTISR